MAPDGTVLDRSDYAPEDQLFVRCGSLSGVRWFVCQTHPQAERWARDNLDNQGFTVYLPLELVRIRDRVLRTMTHEVLRPLFGGYLFVQFDADNDPWRPICSTRGVKRLFMSGTQRPTPVPHGAVERLQAGEASRLSIRSATETWAPGASCRLAAGPFAGHSAAVVSANDRLAVVTLLVFDQLRDVTVPVAHLAAA